MRDGEIDGMQDFDSVIRNMIETETITLEDGLSFATNQNNLLLQLKGFRRPRIMPTRTSRQPMPTPRCTPAADTENPIRCSI